MENQIKVLEYIIGKTIDKVVSDGDELYIRFSDNQFVVLNIETDSNGFGYHRSSICVDKYTKDSTDKNLLELGVITADEYWDSIKREEEEYRLRSLNDEKKLEEQTKISELELLNRLKQKYE